MRRFAWVLSIETGIGCILGTLLFADLPIVLGSDLGVYYAAARALRLDPTINIYQWSLVQQTAACHPIGPYLYPPVLAIALIPLTLLPCDVAFRVWIVLTGALIAGSLVLCQELWPLSRRGFTVLCAATLCSFPLWMGLWYGQIHVLLLFGLLLALWYLRRGRQVWAGVAVAAITSVMLIPGLFLVYFALRRQWRALLGAAVGGAVLLLGMLAVVGWRGVRNWASNILIGASANSDHPSNASLVHLLPWTAPVIVLVYVVVVLRARDAEDAALWTIPTLLLLSPLTWAYLLLWLLPVVRVQWDRGRLAQALCVAAYGAAYLARVAPLVGMAIILALWLAQLYQLSGGRALALLPRKRLARVT
jgi:alpha-1,2-mannosyltransferase